ncbi:Hypothetical predicted protein [Mytilus galloprovincialis]|uniref:Chromo domain-containing protein n=1 Tax=Mytilus galloprovincialis TaxID=29158 RepID=A0A8B6BPT6_MYTGA|nr:Hypothetical predicted protein [Mytilus galloprovincialis]
MFVDDHHKNWDVYIPYVLFAYRSSIQESTQETPFYLMYGRDARLPIDVALSDPTVTYTDADDYKANVLTRLQEAFTLAKDNIQLAQQKQKAYSDKKSAEPDYEIDRYSSKNPDQEDETIEDNDTETHVVVEVLDKLWTRNDEGRLEPKYFVKFENNTKENSWVKPDVIPGQLIEEFEENYKGRGASYRKKKV